MNGDRPEGGSTATSLVNTRPKEAGDAKRQVLQRSILFGSIATPLAAPVGDNTHSWTVYVRGFHGEDISSYVKRIVFKLHESFPNSARGKRRGHTPTPR